MKNKLVRRILSFASAAVLSVSAAAMLAGCDSSNPEVTITYSFHGNDYAVTYVLSRSDAPKTVQHFIELADAGYYDGTCIHDYDDNFIYGGGYYLNEDNELTEKDYFATVKELEKKGATFTQSVFTDDAGRSPLYTLYGEFEENGVHNAGNRENYHSRGALVMYYTDKADSAQGIEVTVPRNDGGENNDGEAYQSASYATNSATSLFYTFLGTTNTSRDAKYAVFGMVKNFEDEMQPLLDAINAYIDDLQDEAGESEEVSFTKTTPWTIDTLDHSPSVAGFEEIGKLFESVRKGGKSVDYNFPQDEPIIVTSVKVNKY